MRASGQVWQQTMSTDSRIAKYLSLVLALVLTAPPGVAFAGADEAREFFKEAKQAYSEGEYERAADLLKKAYSEEANLTYQYNRVRALEGAGEYREALEVLKTYEQPMLDAKGFEDVPKLKASLEEKVEEEPDDSEAADSLREDPDQTETESDGDEETAADDQSDEASAETAEADSQEESATDTTTQASDRQTMRMVGWGLAGLGGAALTVGSLYGSMLFLPGDLRTKVRNDAPLSPDERATFDNHRTMAIVFLSAGAATAIGGTTILLTQGGRQSDQTSAAVSTPEVAPFVTTTSGGAMLQFQF